MYTSYYMYMYLHDKCAYMYMYVYTCTSTTHRETMPCVIGSPGASSPITSPAKYSWLTKVPLRHLSQPWRKPLSSMRLTHTVEYASHWLTACSKLERHRHFLSLVPGHLLGGVIQPSTAHLPAEAHSLWLQHLQQLHEDELGSVGLGMHAAICTCIL